MAGARPIDDLARPRLPGWVRIANAVPDAAARRLWRLDAEGLIAAARRRTGLRDLGDDGFREPLGVLLDALDREAGLSPLGRLGVRRLLLGLLVSRLRLEALFRRHPEIADERVEAPLVVAGLPRTGTTHLLNLLACNPALRTLPYWESLEPIPDPEARPRADGRDPRVVRCERTLALLDRVMPRFRAMHEFTVDGPHEEIQLLAMHFATQLFEASYEVPGYAAWYRDADQTPAYRYLRRVLQALQWLRGPRRWALKSPQHLENLGPLMAVFPDARVVQTHRDPVRIVASLATMIAYGRRMNARRVDPHAVGRHWAHRVEDMLRASLEGRRHVPEGRLLDVRFHEFLADEEGTLERVHAFAGVPWTPEAAAATRAWRRANPRGRHGRVAYRLGALGLDAAVLRERLAFYRERFDLPEEPDEAGG